VALHLWPVFKNVRLLTPQSISEVNVGPAKSTKQILWHMMVYGRYICRYGWTPNTPTNKDIYIYLGPALQLSVCDSAEARSATGFDIFSAVMRTPIISEPILLFRFPMQCTHTYMQYVYIYICKYKEHEIISLEERDEAMVSKPFHPRGLIHPRFRCSFWCEC